MTLPLALAFAALLLAAAAVLPGSLGFLMLTHKLTAHPLGGWIFTRLAAPLYASSTLLAVAAVFLAGRAGDPLLWVLATLAGVVGIGVFGFLMHTRLMFRPVRQPRYLAPDEAVERFGEEEEVAGVIDAGGRSWAYVTRLARRPHLVYQQDGAHPFLLSHCILSHSSMAWELDDRFTGEGLAVSSVLANNLVFYDGANRCSVLQIENRSTDGSYSLATLPTVMTRLGTWRRLFPESKVWYRPREWRDTFYLKLLARATVIDQESPELVYPLERPPDGRLPLKAFVLGVRKDGESKAYPLELFAGAPLVEDTLGGEPLVFFASGDGDFVQLYSRRLGEHTLSFRAAGDHGFEDDATGSTWDVKGSCTGGELRGRQLTALPHYNKIFWCVWADFFPDTAVWGRGEGGV